jgi:ATP-dependent Lhr-like helicase
VADGVRVLGCVPTRQRLVLERFFDESGGTQLVIHSPYGGRINRAFGLALRKRFCRGFGFELQAAANEDAIVLSLGQQQSFELAEVFDYLHPDTVEELLVQAVLPLPMFATRWRWNVCRSLIVARMQSGKRVPAPLVRMRADDELAKAFPDVVACGETLPAGDIEVPFEHPLVAQTLHDCLHEAMDVDGLVELLRDLRSGSIERVAIDTPEPSAFARSILNAQPYAFLDDAPLEERRTQAVMTRHRLDPRQVDELGVLSPEAIARVKLEAWPEPTDADEVHEALLWMGYVTEREAPTWKPWLDELQNAGRVQLEGERWFAVEATRDEQEILAGRLSALGPVQSNDPLMSALEGTGVAMRARVDGDWMWCDRRLLARIHRYTLEGLRKEIEPVSASAFLHYLAHWMHVAPGTQLEGPEGVRQVIEQLAGFEIAIGSWEKRILARRVTGYLPHWLDELGLRGEVAWARLFGSASGALRTTPIALFPRAHWKQWISLGQVPEAETRSWTAAAVHDFLQSHGAVFNSELERDVGLLPSHLEDGLGELLARGEVTNDAFAPLRRLLVPSQRRARLKSPIGRWSLTQSAAQGEIQRDATFVAERLLARYGIVFRRLLERERQPVPWRDLLRALRAMELRGDVRGGRFVAGFSGEQFALPSAVRMLRRLRKQNEPAHVEVAACDPLNLVGIVTPSERVASNSSEIVTIS